MTDESIKNLISIKDSAMFIFGRDEKCFKLVFKATYYYAVDDSKENAIDSFVKSLREDISSVEPAEDNVGYKQSNGSSIGRALS